MANNSAFSEAIAENFYDKEFNVNANSNVKDAEGAFSRQSTGSTQTYKGNVQTTLSKRTIEQYGIKHQVDIAITTDATNSVNIDDEIAYNGLSFTVTDAIVRDTHQLIIGKRK